MKIAYNVKTMQPGCVILQSALGCQIPNFGRLFPSETWTTVADDLAVYPVTEEQLKKLSEYSIKAHEMRKKVKK